MKSCGVIVEYNPFHNGHAYHLAQARELTQAEVVVVVMSGNFVQRGEPAILDKWRRSRLALESGADLVVELPVHHAVQSADYFAAGGVNLLQALEVEALCFGTDSQQFTDYQKFGEFERSHQTEIAEAFQKIKNNGMSYPVQMTEVYRELFPELSLDFSSPNHILGMSYTRANCFYEHPMKIVPIARKDSHHHGEQLDHPDFASGTAIRQACYQKNWEGIKGRVPDNTWQSLQNAPLMSWQHYWPLLKYQLLVQPVEELQHIYQMVEGIEYRLKEKAKEANSFQEFVELVKTKRFTWTRIQRLCVYVLLQMKKNDLASHLDSDYIRILGFNSVGQQFIKEKKKNCGLKLVTNVSKQTEQLLMKDIKAGLVYQQGSSQIAEQDYYRKPIIL